MVYVSAEHHVFLHGDLQEVYMDQPPGYIVSDSENLVCQLKKDYIG